MRASMLEVRIRRFRPILKDINAPERMSPYVLVLPIDKFFAASRTDTADGGTWGGCTLLAAYATDMAAGSIGRDVIQITPRAASKIAAVESHLPVNAGAHEW